jgi:hypothetical protein
MWCGVEVQAIHVEVPRKIYVNSVVDKGSEFGKLVKHTLPRRRPVHYLYELSMSERRFVRYSKDLARLMSDPTIEGVYETKVRVTPMHCTPHCMRARIACRFERAVVTFAHHNLRPSSLSRCPSSTECS